MSWVEFSHSFECFRHIRFKSQSKDIDVFAPIVAQLMFNQAEAWTAEGADHDPELEQRCFQGNPQHQVEMAVVGDASSRLLQGMDTKNWLG